MKDWELLESQAHIAELENLQAKKLVTLYNDAIGVLEQQKANLSAQVKALTFNKVESQARAGVNRRVTKKIRARTLYYWRPGTATAPPSSKDRRLPKSVHSGPMPSSTNT